jgi:hypothetical protein
VSAGRVRAGIVPAARKFHRVSDLEAAGRRTGGGGSGPAGGAAARRGLAAVLGYAVTPDIPPVYLDGAPPDGVAHVPLNDGNRLAADLFHDAHMVCRPGAVSRAVVVPIVENIVAGGRDVRVVLLPAPQRLK